MNDRSTFSSDVSLNGFHCVDDFMKSVCSKDNSVRLDVFSRLEDYLRNESSDLKNLDLNRFVDAIVEWVKSSNFKISINGLIILQLIIQRQTDQLKNFCTEIINPVVDRLGDSKEQVRTTAKMTLIYMMECYTVPFIWDKTMTSFNHKLCKVREEVLCLLDITLNK
jgi:hypothetical protein